ncbi:putative recombination initiation defects 3 [Nicotiana sylvestris]|uniref:Protein PAIR1-like isoform X2 n=2 Tax=Nicotiana TaxID=4085 RepID=A0A1S4BSV5_TOBAC|nr:PREDICTED: protein PAIR1 isoform X2 [Nicotiana sylvestris]XP_016491964.1 PREDICTED: protein PAIR1-like isoform X2 [Nicotiana tabacum]
MKLKINKASDLSSISVLPPHARRPSAVPSAAESSVFGKSQASQVRSQQQSQQSFSQIRSQQQSQQSFSQGFSSQQPMYSQLSQSSLDEFAPNEQRLGSQERENSAKRMNCLPQISYTREESQMQLSKPSGNYMRKWSVPENKSQITEELEHKIGIVETSLSRLGMILDSVQSDIMQVNRGTKEILMEMESLRPKLAAHDELLQLMNKGREDLKASMEETFKSMFEELRENKYQENIRDLSSLVRAMPNKLEMCILQLQTDLSKNLAKEIQTASLRPDCPGQKHETVLAVQPKGINDCFPLPEVKFLKNSTMNIKDQKTTMSTKTETGGWKTVKHDQTCVKQKISSRSHKQNKAFRQEREFGVTIESDEDIDTGFSCLLEENGSGAGICPIEDAKEESARILRKARRRKRKHLNTIIID